MFEPNNAFAILYPVSLKGLQVIGVPQKLGVVFPVCMLHGLVNVAFPFRLWTSCGKNVSITSCAQYMHGVNGFLWFSYSDLFVELLFVPGTRGCWAECGEFSPEMTE
jgi:hypothetical protein